MGTLRQYIFREKGIKVKGWKHEGCRKHMEVYRTQAPSEIKTRRKKERHFYARLSEAWIAVKKAEGSLKQWWHTGEQLERWVCSDSSLYFCVTRGKVLIEFL